MVEIIILIWLVLFTALLAACVLWVRYRGADWAAEAIAESMDDMVCKTCGNLGVIRGFKPCPECRAREKPNKPLDVTHFGCRPDAVDKV